MQKRELVLIASCIAVAAAVGTFHVACSGRAVPVQSGAQTQTPDQAGKSAAAEEIFGINRKATLRAEDVSTLERYMSSTDSAEELIKARNAVVVSADRLKNATVPPDDRARLESLLVGTLSHPLWRMRLSGLAALANYPVPNRPEIIQQMKLLRNDSNPEVAKLATRLKLEGD